MTTSARLRHLVYRFHQVLLAIVALLAPTLSFAAETATLSGIVRDPSDAAIARAAVTIREQSSGTERRTSTNNSGLFTAPALQAGIYTVSIAAQGFKGVTSTDVQLNVAEVKQIDFTLEVGDVAQTISVDGASPMINTIDGSVGMTIDSQFVSNLPLNGRSFQQLITLAPGVNLTSGTADRGEFSVNGQRATSNYFTVDGVNANLGLGAGYLPGTGEGLNAAGGTNSLVSVDALQEFRIITNSFAPEYGRTPGGQVILLTRSGSNALHGSLFEYFRNDKLDANDWFANSQRASRAPLRFNDFGGTVGGPIFKNKTFFFLSFEGQRLTQPQFGVEDVPDMTLRHTAPAPLRPVLDAFPAPNGPELGAGQAQFSANYSNPISVDATSLRVDHSFNSRLNGFVRYSYAPSSSVMRGGGVVVSSAFTQPFQAQTATVGITYSITPRLVDELRLNYSTNSLAAVYSLDTFGGAVPFATSLVFAPSPPFTDHNATAELIIQPFGSIEVGAHSGETLRQGNVVDALSYTIGGHQLKFGVDYLRSLPIDLPQNIDIYSFNSISSVQNNLLNTFYAYTEPEGRADVTNLSLYAQDSWRISERFTLTYGMRWDFNPPPSSRYPHNDNHVQLLGSYSGGAVTVGPPGSQLWEPKFDNFAPRIGVAYQLRRKKDWQTIVRAGVGLFYDTAEQDAIFAAYNESFPNLAKTPTLSGLPFPISTSQAAFPVQALTKPGPGAAFQVYPNDLAAPRTWQWNVSMQQALGDAQTLTLSYVAVVGRKLLYGQYYPAVGPNQYQVDYYDNSASSNYQSLQVQFQRRLRRGITASASYVWSHSLDDSSLDFAALVPGTYFGPKSNWAILTLISAKTSPELFLGICRAR